jgi:C-terminal processing protease CtpA/Prc
MIRRMAWNVRRDTMGTIEWAMSLEDPEERRAAMEAINDRALVGIGAQIAMDDTGLPRIETALPQGAIEASGMVEPGDRIRGIIDSDGSKVYFQGRSLRVVMAMLRGSAGSNARLLMERDPGEGETEPYQFEVPIQRSMVVVQPPPPRE